eukprot:COSAG05_NODE_1368_length_5060_cov_5.437412_1_plen_133_part_00
MVASCRRGDKQARRPSYNLPWCEEEGKGNIACSSSRSDLHRQEGGDLPVVIILIFAALCVGAAILCCRGKDFDPLQAEREAQKVYTCGGCQKTIEDRGFRKRGSESDHLCEECYQGLGPAEKEGYEDFERWG